ncbi:MAG: hypothetical protein RXO24_12265 [Acidilobus sp.]
MLPAKEWERRDRRGRRGGGVAQQVIGPRALPGLLASLGTTLTSTDWNGPASVPVVLMPLRNRPGL